MQKVINVAILGFGTVGSGVFDVINHLPQRNIIVRKVFDKPEKAALLGNLHTSDYQEILHDPAINVVVETLGGYDFAYLIIKKALLAGKNVVTANKDVISKNLAELLAIAKDQNVALLYEASVGGGIPIIQTLIKNLAVNQVNHVWGILNGTTNYILTKMQDNKQSFSEALKDAQAKGFAESDPTMDIEGYDLARKITILSSLAFNCKIDREQVAITSIKGVNQSFLRIIASYGFNVKYLANALLVNNEASVEVLPIVVSNDHPFANVKDENNIVGWQGTYNNTIQLIGKGAGSFPTACAVVTDIINIQNDNYVKDYHDETSMVIQTNIDTKKYYLVQSDGIELPYKKISGDVYLTDKILKQTINNCPHIIFWACLWEEENVEMFEKI